MTELRERILKEMVVEHSDALERSFEKAKKLIGITSTGKIELSSKSKFSGPERLTLYYIGKLFAKEAGLSESESVSNSELAEELGEKTGSILPWTKTLRDTGIIKAVASGDHVVQRGVIERELGRLLEKVGGVESGP